MENNNFLKLATEERGSDGYVESSAEYILPDYNPDVRKLLYTSCEVKPAGKFSADEQVDFSGIVEYRCVYADKDGELSEVSFTSDYEYGISLAGEAVDVDSTPWVQNYQVRVLGPRKIAAKASIVCENVYTNERSVGGEIPSGEDIQLEERRVSCGRIKRIESEERELAEEISRLDGVSLDEVSVISATADCKDSTLERAGGEARCHTDFAIRILYRDIDGSVVPLESMLSGDGTVELSGIPEDAGLICTPHILSERFECLPTEDGVNMVANLIVKWDVTCVYNEEHSVVCDGYSTDFALDNKYSTLTLVSYGTPVKETLTLEGRITPDSTECGKIKEVLLMGERARITEKKLEDGALNLSVEVKAQGVISCVSDDGKTAYAPIKIAESISEKVNLSSKTSANQGAIARISGIDILQKIDGDDIKYTLSVTIDIIPLYTASKRVLVSAERNEEQRVEKTSGRVTVYYTEPGDTLFSVAKKYHTTSSGILENNEIVVETSGGKNEERLPKRLIIY